MQTKWGDFYARESDHLYVPLMPLSTGVLMFSIQRTNLWSEMMNTVLYVLWWLSTPITFQDGWKCLKWTDFKIYKTWMYSAWCLILRKKWILFQKWKRQFVKIIDKSNDTYFRLKYLINTFRMSKQLI